MRKLPRKIETLNTCFMGMEKVIDINRIGFVEIYRV